MTSAPRTGLALGSGSARGWAHIGAIEALLEAGVCIPIVCGSSIGALVGAAYAGGHLERLKRWVLSLDPLDIARLLDPTLRGGGFIQGERLMAALSEQVSDLSIESLDTAYACTATDLVSGREVWIRHGSLVDAVRASIALPGLFTPVWRDGSWLADGGLCDPVPVSLCRALGAELIIAVNLNGDLVGRAFKDREDAGGRRAEHGRLAQLLERLPARLKGHATALLGPVETDPRAPGLLEVITSSLNIMQDRITRSRMAGDPPDVIIAPRLAHIGLMEYHRAEESIEAGYQAARRKLPDLLERLES